MSQRSESNASSNSQQQYERDKQAIISSLFLSRNDAGEVLESHIIHVRVVEDSHYSSSRPPANSPDSAKKDRIIIVSVRHNGRVRVHKARQNPNGTFQIGKTWNLDELTRVEADAQNPLGFLLTMGKPYYWMAQSEGKRTTFLHGLLKIYGKYTKNKYIETVNVEAPELSPSNSASTSASSSSHPPPVASISQVLAPKGAPVPRLGSQGHAMGTQSSQGSIQGSQGSIQGSQGSIQGNHSSIQGYHGNNQSSQGNNQSSQGNNQSSQGNNQSSQGNNQSSQGNNQSSQGNNQNRQFQPTVPSQLRKGSVPGPPSDSGSKAGPASRQGSVVSAYGPSSRKGSVAADSVASRVEMFSAPPASSSSFASSALQAPIPISQTSSRRPSGGPPSSPLLAQTPMALRPGSPRIARKQSESPDMRSGPADQQFERPEASLPLKQTVSVSTVASTASSGGISQGELTATPSAPTGLGLEQNLLQPTDSHKSQSSISNIKFRSRDNLPNGVVEPVDADEPSLRKASNTSSIKYELSESEPVNRDPPKNPNWKDENRRSRYKRLSVMSTDSGYRRRLSFSAVSSASVVEDVLSEFNWSGHDDSTALERRISEELAKIEAQNLHTVVDLDDRLDDLDKNLEAAIQECDSLGGALSAFSIQLRNMGSDIAHIEGQGEGLQIRAVNQKLLSEELERMLASLALDENMTNTLMHGDLGSLRDIALIENYLRDLYRPMRAHRESATTNGAEFLSVMTAFKERKGSYEHVTSEFVARFKVYAESRFKQALQIAEQVSRPASSNGGLLRFEGPFLKETLPMGGMMMFVREVDSSAYVSIYKAYERVIKPFYQTELAAFFAKKGAASLQDMAKRTSLTFYAKSNALSIGGLSTSGGGVLSSSIKRSGTLAARLRPDLGLGINKDSGDEGPASAVPAAGPGSLSSVAPSDVIQFDTAAHTTLKKTFKAVLDQIAEAVASQQEVLSLLFHLSSAASGKMEFPDFVQRLPVQERVEKFQFSSQPKEIDSDRAKAQETVQLMSSVFANLQDEMAKLFNASIHRNGLIAAALLAHVEVAIARAQSTNQEFMMQVFQKLEDRIAGEWHKYVGAQIKTIQNTIVSSKKRRGVLHFVRIFPVFCQVVQGDMDEILSGDLLKSAAYRSVFRVRQIVDESYNKVMQAILQNLQRIAKERASGANDSSTTRTDDYEDKEKLNYHILMVENMNVLIEGLEPLDQNDTLVKMRELAMRTYRDEMSLYVQVVVHRPLHKLREFVQGIDAILQRNPGDDPSKRHGYSKSALKRLLSQFDSKEVRKGIDALQKRVEKHFIGEDERPTVASRAVYNKVWSAIRSEYVEFHVHLEALTQKYYNDADDRLSVDFTRQDINTAFQRGAK